MTFAEYSDYDALGLAALVDAKEVSPGEVLEAAIERVERHNPALNAIVHEAYDEARAVAAGSLPDGPFKGVPFLIKDIGCPVKGWPQTDGSRFLAGRVAAEDGVLTRRFREAGLVLMGKTNTPEFGITGTTEGQHLGPCRNPWDTDHIAGGSSGGAAAAVAAGVLPLAHAADGLGSIRIPAACCGLFGMKVTRDRNPGSANDHGTSMGWVVEHVVSRSVRDSAAMLDATDAPEPGAPFAYPAKDGAYLKDVSTPPGKLRVWFHSEAPNGRQIHPEVRAALEETAALLESLGHHVEERGLGVDYRKLYAAQGMASGPNFVAGLDRRIAEMGREPEPDEFEPLTWRIFKGARKIDAALAATSWADLRTLCRQIVGLFEDVDVILSPVMGTPVPKIGYIDPVALDPRDVNKRQAEVFPFTPPYNFTGQPAMSVPLATSSNGLPIGMMFAGRYGDEATLFRLAAQLEEARPWAGRTPQLWS